MESTITIDGLEIEGIGAIPDTGSELDGGIEYFRLYNLDDGFSLFPTDADFNTWLQREIPPKYCSCSHDCCGHKFTHFANIIGLSDDYWIFSIRWGVSV